MNSKKKKAYLDLTICMLVIAGAFYFMDSYLLSYIKSMSDEIVSAKKTTAQIEERNNKIDEVRKNYNDIEKEIGIISDTFVKKDFEKVGGMFMNLEEIAKTYDIELSKSPSTKEEERMGASISAAYFNLSATGEYDNMMKFLVYLDNFKYYIDLNNIEIINSSADQKGSSMISMRAELEVYLDTK